ncbi:TIGR00730 family Rossman fold protein [Pelagibacterales bacterium SAG-MED31]|nr:TIGR00730 family Rossman fold protein [Pelagibacterales bacterium SAG-MED31]
MKIKALTIYCSASQKLDKKFYKLAKETAEIISNYQIKVIYGGGNVGLMGIIAQTLKNLKSEVIGIIPKFLVKKEKVSFDISKLKVVPSMSKRKEYLFKLGDAFLVLPGGTGTLEEVVEVLSWKILKLHNKPIIFLNYENYWSPLLKQFEKIIENKFGNKNLQNQFQVIKNPNQLNKILKSWTK